MKIRKIIMAILLTGIFGAGFGLMLSGCSGANDSLEKAHIMNNGCFITCYNKANNGVFAGKHINKAAYKSGHIKHYADSNKING